MKTDAIIVLIRIPAILLSFPVAFFMTRKIRKRKLIEVSNKLGLESLPSKLAKPQG